MCSDGAPGLLRGRCSCTSERRISRKNIRNRRLLAKQKSPYATISRHYIYNAGSGDRQPLLRLQCENPTRTEPESSCARSRSYGLLSTPAASSAVGYLSGLDIDPGCSNAITESDCSYQRRGEPRHPESCATAGTDTETHLRDNPEQSKPSSLKESKTLTSGGKFKIAAA
jgi:hypothetical protein